MMVSICQSQSPALFLRFDLLKVVRHQNLQAWGAEICVIPPHLEETYMEPEFTTPSWV